MILVIRAYMTPTSSGTPGASPPGRRIISISSRFATGARRRCSFFSSRRRKFRAVGSRSSGAVWLSLTASALERSEQGGWIAEGSVFLDLSIRANQPATNSLGTNIPARLRIGLAPTGRLRHGPSRTSPSLPGGEKGRRLLQELAKAVEIHRLPARVSNHGIRGARRDHCFRISGIHAFHKLANSGL